MSALRQQKGSTSGAFYAESSSGRLQASAALPRPATRWVSRGSERCRSYATAACKPPFGAGFRGEEKSLRVCESFQLPRGCSRRLVPARSRPMHDQRAGARKVMRQCSVAHSPSCRAAMVYALRCWFIEAPCRSGQRSRQPPRLDRAESVSPSTTGRRNRPRSPERKRDPSRRLGMAPWGGSARGVGLNVDDSGRSGIRRCAPGF